MSDELTNEDLAAIEANLGTATKADLAYMLKQAIRDLRRAREERDRANATLQSIIGARESGWVSTAKRMPEGGQRVLISTVEGGIITDLMMNDGRFCDASAFRLTVTHWHPLPAPPQPNPASASQG